MLVFKYLLRVFKYLTTAYNNHLVIKICIVINYCAHIRPTWTVQNYQKIKDTYLKSSDSLQYVVETQMNESLSIYSI